MTQGCHLQTGNYCLCDLDLDQRVAAGDEPILAGIDATHLVQQGGRSTCRRRHSRCRRDVHSRHVCPRLPPEVTSPALASPAPSTQSSSGAALPLRPTVSPTTRYVMHAYALGNRLPTCVLPPHLGTSDPAPPAPPLQRYDELLVHRNYQLRMVCRAGVCCFGGSVGLAHRAADIVLAALLLLPIVWTYPHTTGCCGRAPLGLLFRGAAPFSQPWGWG